MNVSAMIIEGLRCGQALTNTMIYPSFTACLQGFAFQSVLSLEAGRAGLKGVAIELARRITF
jgi:hypothetical protein